MPVRLLSLATALVVALPGCDEPSEIEAEASVEITDDAAPPAVYAVDAVDVDDPPPLAASGRIENADSPISPWCDAVLVAPDVAVTMTHCIAGHYEELFTVSFGDPAAPRTANVAKILDDLDPEDRFTALLLETPVIGIEPATLQATPARRCGFDSVSHLHADKRIEGNLASRWIWSGCLDRDELVARNGKPNCHGEEGSGVFADGQLVGLTVGPGAFEPDVLCTTGVRVATVRDAEAFFDAALQASRW